MYRPALQIGRARFDLGGREDIVSLGRQTHYQLDVFRAQVALGDKPLRRQADPGDVVVAVSRRQASGNDGLRVVRRHLVR